MLLRRRAGRDRVERCSGSTNWRAGAANDGPPACSRRTVVRRDGSVLRDDPLPRPRRWLRQVSNNWGYRQRSEVRRAGQPTCASRSSRRARDAALAALHAALRSTMRRSCGWRTTSVRARMSARRSRASCSPELVRRLLDDDDELMRLRSTPRTRRRFSGGRGVSKQGGGATTQSRRRRRGAPHHEDESMLLYIAKRLLLGDPGRLRGGAGVLPAGTYRAGRPAGVSVLPPDASQALAERRCGRLRLRPAAARAVRPLALEGCCRAISAPRSPPAARSWRESLRARSATPCCWPAVATADRLRVRRLLRLRRRLFPRLLARQARLRAWRWSASQCRITGSAWCW